MSFFQSTCFECFKETSGGEFLFNTWNMPFIGTFFLSTQHISFEEKIFYKSVRLSETSLFLIKFQAVVDWKQSQIL